MLAFNFFFLPPLYTLTLSDSRNWFALLVFVCTAIVVSELATRGRRRAREAALLAEIASSLLEHGTVGSELERISAEAARALQVERAEIVLGDDTGDAGNAVELLAGGRRIGWIKLGGRMRGDASARRRAPAGALLVARGCARPRASRRRGARGGGAAPRRRDQDRTATRGQPRPADAADGDLDLRRGTCARRSRDRRGRPCRAARDDSRRLRPARPPRRQPARPLAAAGRRRRAGAGAARPRGARCRRTRGARRAGHLCGGELSRPMPPRCVSTHIRSSGCSSI